MTIEKVKQIAKERFGQDITDEQAAAYMEKYVNGELADEELSNVAGGWVLTDVTLDVENMDKDKKITYERPDDYTTPSHYKNLCS